MVEFVYMENQINQESNPESFESIVFNKNSKLNILLIILVILLLILGSYWFFIIYKNKEVKFEETTMAPEVTKEEIYCNCNTIKEGFCTDCEIKIDDKIFSIYRRKQEQHFHDAELILREKDNSYSEVLIKNLIFGTEMASEIWGPKIERDGKYLIWHDGGVGAGGAGFMSHDYVINSQNLDIYRIVFSDGGSIIIQKIDKDGKTLEDVYIGFNFIYEDSVPIKSGFKDGKYTFDSLIVGDNEIGLGTKVFWERDSSGGLDFEEYYGPVRLEIIDFDKNFIVFEIESEIQEIKNKTFKYNIENKRLSYEDGTEINWGYEKMNRTESIKDEKNNVDESNSMEIFHLKSGVMKRIKTATSTTIVINGNDGSNSTTTMTTEEMNYIEDNTVYGCGNKECFENNFQNCISDYVSSNLGFLGSTYYKIEGKANTGCNLSFKYNEYPDSNWVNKEMVCVVDNTLDFEASTIDMFNLVSSGQLECSGPLFEILRPKTYIMGEEVGF